MNLDKEAVERFVKYSRGLAGTADPNSRPLPTDVVIVALDDERIRLTAALRKLLADVQEAREHEGELSNDYIERLAREGLGEADAPGLPTQPRT